MKLFFPAIRARSDIARRCSRMMGHSSSRTIAMNRSTMRSGLRRLRVVARSAVDIIAIQIRAFLYEWEPAFSGLSPFSAEGWYTGFRGHEPRAHCQQVLQRLGLNARQARQHHRMLDVVLSEVIDLGICGHQRRTVLKRNANRQRSALGR